MFLQITMFGNVGIPKFSASSTSGFLRASHASLLLESPQSGSAGCVGRWSYECPCREGAPGSSGSKQTVRVQVATPQTGVATVLRKLLSISVAQFPYLWSTGSEDI